MEYKEELLLKKVRLENELKDVNEKILHIDDEWIERGCIGVYNVGEIVHVRITAKLLYYEGGHYSKDETECHLVVFPLHFCVF